MSDLFTWSEAVKARDAGMARALDNAGAFEDWAHDFLVVYARTHEVFISENVSAASKEAGKFPQPQTDRSWGAIYSAAAKNGVIVKDGTGRSLRRHASICVRWRSLIWGKA